jgi:hypothetical protein
VNDQPLDLTASHTATYPGDTQPTTITPTIRTKVRNGVTLTIVSGLAPLLADQIDAIADEGDRLHTLTVLRGDMLTIRDTPDDAMPDGVTGGCLYRDQGTLGTTYMGTRDLPAAVVLDLAERLRAQLG